MYDDDDIEALKQRRICFRCVGEDYLSQEIRAGGQKRKCSYCGKTRQSWLMEDMAGRVETAFDQHFCLTSEQPNSMERMMLSDRESSYDWERHGDPVIEAIGMAAVLDEEPARDIQKILADEYADLERDQMGEETPFSEDTYYEEKDGDTSEWERRWREFVKSLKHETRYFNAIADEFLHPLFKDIHCGSTTSTPIVVEAGPGRALNCLFRARVFLNDADLREAIARPDLHLGPPPGGKAAAGRMNAPGISVFYGAGQPGVAVAEVRPPVGSCACVARFELIRSVRLLDLRALAEAYETGSIFDTGFIHRYERAMFLQRLTEKLTIPVMPGDETMDYLPTQVIADFLASQVQPTLDGIIFPSVQAAEGGTNVVLFRNASKVEPIALPEGTEIESCVDRSWEDAPAPEYVVYEYVPKVEDPPPTEEEFFGLSAFAPWTYNEDEDYREPALKIDLTSIQVHAVEGVLLKTKAADVRRHRTGKRNKSEY